MIGLLVLPMLVVSGAVGVRVWPVVHKCCVCVLVYVPTGNTALLAAGPGDPL